jgi:hypothetical protein
MPTLFKPIFSILPVTPMATNAISLSKYFCVPLFSIRIFTFDFKAVGL